jgi:CO/xanthine dehydrogenase FAD-binding subunit
VGVRFDVDGAGLITAARLVVSALQARPHKVNLDALVGKPLDDAAVAYAAQTAHQRCSPTTNIADDPAWRKEMVPVFVRRACDQARGLASSASSSSAPSSGA